MSDGLSFDVPNPLTFNVASGSGATSQNVTIFNSGALATVSNVSATTTTGQAWLSPFLSGSQGIVTLNVNPSFLGVGSYTGTVFVPTTVGQVSFTVNLNVGTGGGTGFGLVASPNPVSFNVAAGSGITSQNVTITLNGVATTVNSIASTSTNSGQGWLQPSLSGIFGTVMVSVNPSALFSGSDTGTVVVNTPSGQVSFTVSLSLGGLELGLVAIPNQFGFARGERKQRVRKLEDQSDPVLDNESKERALVGEVISTVALAGQIRREFNVSDHGIDMEIEFKNDAGEATGKKLYLQLKSGDSYLRKRQGDEAEVYTIKKERHTDYWMEQAFPVLLVIRTSEGEVRWMEVRDKLKRAQKPVKQIVFEGERFDVMSVRRWRDKALGQGLA